MQHSITDSVKSCFQEEVSADPFCPAEGMMPSGNLPPMAFEGEPEDEGSPSYSATLWSLGLNPWPLTPETLSSAGVHGGPVGTRGQGCGGNYPRRAGPSGKQGELW